MDERKARGNSGAGAAATLLADPSNPAARRKLIEALYDSISRGLSRGLGLGRDDDDPLLDSSFVDFCDSKLLSREFLQGLVGADSGEAFAFRSAANFATDRLRRGAGARGRVEELHEETHAAAVDDDLDEPATVVLEHQERFAAFAEDDRRFCFVVQAVWPSPDWVVESLARKRAVPAATVLAELEIRARGQGQRRDELVAERDRRGNRILRLMERIARLRAIIDAQDGGGVDALVPAPADLESRLEDERAQRAASAEERSALMASYLLRLDQLHERQAETRRKLDEPLPANKRWDQVLAILGESPSDSSERAKAVNRVTQRYLRLQRKIRGGGT